MSERELIDACIANDRLAQHTLYERYKRAMFTLAYRMTGDFGLAGETLQDAFLKVFQFIGDFQGRSTLGAWIKTIVARTAVRKMQRRPLPYDELPAFKEPAGTPDRGTAALDTEYLEQAILALPEGYRLVFVLTEIEGMSHREIGEVLGISEGTSKSQLFYAKKRLREALALSLKSH